MEMLNDGILSIDETEGEEISLTAEGPQLTEEEKLRIESEKEEGDDEDVKRIDLFASEDKEGDPLNNLLVGEDGITTLFMKKGGRVPFQGGGRDASSDDFGGSTSGGTGGSQGPAGGASSSGNYGGNQNTGGGDKNQGSDQGHSRFDVGSGYYGEEVTTTSSDDGDDKPSKDPILDMVNKKIVKDPNTGGNIVVDKNAVLMKEKKLKLSKGKRPAAWVDPKMKEYYDNMDKYIAENTGLLSAYNIEKQLTNYIIDQIPVIGPFIPTQYPSVNINFESIGKYEVPGSDLGFYDPDEYPEFYKDGPDEEDKDDSAIKQIIAANQAIEDRDETDIFNIWDKIKAKQAQRAYLVSEGIIQDNSEIPQTKEAMMLNSGGLANLFRVKTQ